MQSTSELHMVSCPHTTGYVCGFVLDSVAQQPVKNFQDCKTFAGNMWQNTRRAFLKNEDPTWSSRGLLWRICWRIVGSKFGFCWITCRICINCGWLRRNANGSSPSAHTNCSHFITIAKSARGHTRVYSHGKVKVLPQSLRDCSVQCYLQFTRQTANRWH